jgi:N-acyl-D-aspartate/D-glutamate deacylase
MRALRLMQWPWPEAFRRCSYLPAEVLRDVTPAMRRKGRLSAGADADLVVLDPGALTDRATYTDPAQPSAGVRHLLVNGEFVIRDGELDLGAYPGRAVRAG